MTKKAVLFANLGSPDDADVPSVRRYLNQFLMDGHVIQAPWLIRRMIVSLFVLPTRPKQSAEAYQSVWTDEGSPLIVLSQKLIEKVTAKVKVPVGLAMRYGNPSIESQLLAMNQQGIDEIFYVPLYPHYADSTVTTSIAEANRVINKHKLPIKLEVIEPFYQHPDYINALVASAKPYLEQDYDHLIFSYHGLPESHITKRDPSGNHCLKSNDCCQKPNEVQNVCYRHQVMVTTQRFVEKVGLTASDYSVAFQSRLGRQKWLEPSTEHRIIELAKQGKKKVLVICPAFVTDCLETLEEIAMEGQEIFEEAGGETLTLIPCMNDSPEWVDVLASWANEATT